MSLKGSFISFSETEEKSWLPWSRQQEGEIMAVDSIFPARRDATSTAASDRCRAKPPRRPEKVWNEQFPSGVGEGADYKAIKCLSEPEGREIQRP